MQRALQSIKDVEVVRTWRHASLLALGACGGQATLAKVYRSL